MTPPIATTPAPDNTVAPDVGARLSRLLESFVTHRGLHHAVATIATGDGTLRWSAACSPAGSDDPPHAESPFFTASITKRFIITLVVQAHERGELDLSAPITTYLPAETVAGLHVLGGVDRTSEITVRHLASHTSGLPDYFEKRRGGPSLHDQLRAGRDQAWSFEDVLRIVREEQRPHFVPQDLTAARQKARYSDTGFQLLIRIAEAATGRSFAGLLAERITIPLGLTRTWLPGQDRPVPLPLHTGQHQVELTSLIESSNDVISTTGDLLTFQRALLAGEPFDHAGSVALLTERRNRLRNIPILRYGLGTMFFNVGRLMTAGRSPLTLVGHSGATGTWLFHCPELDLHLAGTVDQTHGQALPFRLVARMLHIWR
ncbi:serine hydrolase domain-containing protein [Prauserella muralis]|uniref:Penicillin-binding protein n=1 Tax=Prauserella muralis TaxID=588067 RepID=A0A2V4AJ55_9PSEU|nr:serine hydrolase domain-containing protein [Prauserella muralis]PXY18883.1 penicillin-binding protein [Prauserella muralis]TWE28745.1 CubicO group peptidase (beta-lactamase class C family) [Prauserella muralis]